MQKEKQDCGPVEGSTARIAWDVVALQRLHMQSVKENVIDEPDYLRWRIQTEALNKRNLSI